MRGVGGRESGEGVTRRISTQPRCCAGKAARTAAAFPRSAAYFVMSAPVNPALMAGSSRFSTRLARTSPVLST